MDRYRQQRERAEKEGTYRVVRFKLVRHGVLVLFEVDPAEVLDRRWRGKAKREEGEVGRDFVIRGIGEGGEW